MSIPDPVGAIIWPSDSGCGDAERFQFIRCVDGREPKVHEVWILGEDGVTPKVHPTAWVDIWTGIFGEFSTHYLTENRCRTPIFCKKSINGSFEFLGVPDPLRTNCPPWIDNFLVPSSAWGVGVTVTNLNWEVNLAASTEVFPYPGVVPSLPILLTSLGVLKYARRCALRPWQSPLRESSGALPKSHRFPQHPQLLSSQLEVLSLGWYLGWAGWWIRCVDNLRW